MARPTNEERYSPQRQKDELKKLCGEAIVQLRKQIKRADANTLARFIMQMLPVVLNDDTQTTSDITLELLAKKALKVRMSIKETTEAQQVSEEIVDEEET